MIWLLRSEECSETIITPNIDVSLADWVVFMFSLDLLNSWSVLKSFDDYIRL
jgi:hypothetical protein